MRRIPDKIKSQVIRTYTTPNPDGTWTGAKIISDIFGITDTSVYNILADAGIQSRDAREAHSGGKRCKPIKNVPPENETIPLCKCGCGHAVAWNRRKNHWNIYIDGHYRQDAPYKNQGWLYEQYIDQNRAIDDIALEYGVNRKTISRYIKRFSIPTRTQAESLALSGAVRGPNNPAWKGGVADWDYSYDWKALCKRIKDRDEWTCQGCKQQRKRWGIHLHVHHIDGNKLNNSPDNLISLCAQCHRNVHSGHQVL